MEHNSGKSDVDSKPGPKPLNYVPWRQYPSWTCPICTAGCTFEAMEWCCQDDCPVMRGECAVLETNGCQFEFTPLPTAHYHNEQH